MISIRRRLLLWLLSALGLIGLLASAVTYLQVREDVNGLFDYQLRQIAYSLRYQPVAAPRPEQDESEGEEDLSDFVTQVWSRDGTLIYTSRPDLALPRFSDHGLATRSWRGERWRVFQVSGPGRVVQVAQPMNTRREMAASLALRVLGPVLALIPLLGAVIWISVGRGLRPLREISAELGARTPSAMTPLPQSRLPLEVAPLVAALNDLLERLSRAMQVQRRFVADAAHELRTPLTAVQLQLQLVERAATPAERAAGLARLASGVHRAVHLVQQLLALARVEPDAAQRALAPVALDDLARAAAADHAALAMDKGVDLGVARAEPVTVSGDAESLRVMLGNLLDNAIRYTPPGGRVDLSVYARDGEAVLQVEDTGPGIPREERERVFDRFYRRSGQDAQGSGLGLAIVKSILERHGGRISLDAGRDGRGLQITVTFASVSL